MNYRLRPHPQMPRIYLYREPVDFRKSYRGLAAIVEQELGHNPFEGALYAFTNRRRDKIKLLYWEDNGFVLYYKSLAEEKFYWPKGQASLRSRERFWDIRVPKIDSIFDNSLVPRTSWSPGVPPQHRKLVAATHRSPI